MADLVACDCSPFVLLLRLRILPPLLRLCVRLVLIERCLNGSGEGEGRGEVVVGREMG